MVMPELTVAMPARNTGEFIGEAVESVLGQEGVDFELIVVDDASEDDTREVVRSFKDPRVRLIENEKRMGISYCLNLIIDASGSPFIAQVDSDDIVLPWALRKMTDAMKGSPDTGQAHCLFLLIDTEGEILRRSTHSGGDIDYKRELLVKGGIMNPLRTYRKEVFGVVGKFDETLTYSEDTEMAIRIVDKYDIKHVTEYLYCRRIHGGNHSRSVYLRELRFWLKRVIFCRRLRKSDRTHFLNEKGYFAYLLVVRGFLRSLHMTALRLLGPGANKILGSKVKRLSGKDR
jgi:glycosyltransferase involved in cell wall biosynthesis